jgi:hypothetical protein
MLRTHCYMIAKCEISYWNVLGGISKVSQFKCLIRLNWCSPSGTAKLPGHFKPLYWLLANPELERLAAAEKHIFR